MTIKLKITVEVEPDIFEEAKRKAARKLSRRVKIPGFRPGKAPYQVVLRQFGEPAIIEDALEFLVEDIYPKVIEESEIKPYGPGKLDNVASMDPPILEFVVPLDAEVTLGDYKSIEKTYEPVEVSDQDVEDVIKDLQDRQAILEPVERPVEEGDVVTVSISGERKDVEDDQDPILVKDRETPVLVLPEDSKNEQEWPYPGFSRVLIGMSVGDEKTTTHTFSDESDYEELRGVEAGFTFNVNEIKKRVLPEANDEFASTVGEYETLETLRAAIRESLEMQAKDSYNEDYDDEILKEAVEQSEFKYPPQMLEDEIDQVIHNLENRLKQQNLDLDLYLKTREIDMDGLKEEARSTAETRLKRSLLLYELAQAENIVVETDEVQKETIRTLDALTRSISKQDAKKLANESSVRNVMNNVMADLLARKAVERLRSLASGISLEEEVAEEEAAEEPAEAEQAPVDEEAQVEATAIEATTVAETSAKEDEAAQIPEATGSQAPVTEATLAPVAEEPKVAKPRKARTPKAKAATPEVESPPAEAENPEPSPSAQADPED